MTNFTLQPNDVIIDLSNGVTQPTMASVVKISKSWFRRKRPYQLVRTHDRGMVSEILYTWTSQKVIDSTLKHSKVQVVRNGVVVHPKGVNK